MADKSIIRFVHEGKAAYPDVRAYMEYFSGAYKTVECRPEEAEALAGSEGPTACWYMMGFYRKRVPGVLTIHDYRSLSVGRFRRGKDFLKRLLNVDPDIRIFQNDAIRKALGFTRDGRTIYLPMGVPRMFIDQRDLVADPTVDFIYIGSMLGERKCELMLDSFLKRFGATKSFDLYGPRNPELEARYSGKDNIRFRGLVDQAELPRLLKSARVGVCYFPVHYPHVLQTPTKLMEYAALGMRILANEHPQSRITSDHYGIACQWGDTADMFAGVPDSLDWATNQALDPAAMEWGQVIAASGIEEALSRSLGKPARR